MSDFYSSFSNPFMGLPGAFGGFSGGDWANVPLPDFSSEGMIGGEVNPYAPNLSGGTGGEDVGAAADTDKGRALAGAKGSNLQNVLKGVQAPKPPTPQTVRSPAAPQMAAQKSQLSTLLASMGVTPQQLLRLGQTMGRG